MLDPTSLIAQQRQKVSEADAAVAAATQRANEERHVLAGMEALDAAFRSVVGARSISALKVGTSTINVERPKNSGRQPGSITKEWRMVLARLGDKPFTAADLAAYPWLLFQRNVSVAEGRRRLHLFMQHNYVEQAGEGLFRVTSHAVEKFGLKSLTENGEANADPDDRDEGDPSPLAPDFKPLADD